MDVNDYGLYVATFGQQGCGLAGDLNADQEVDVLDFAVYLSEFGANELGPCTVETETESLTGWPDGGPLAGLLESLGYESIAEYSEWLDSLSHAEQIEELAVLFELAQGE